MSEQVYLDNPAIADETRLFRRVHPKQLARDDDTGLARVSSGVFRDKDLSIYIESVLAANNQPSEHCLAFYPEHKLVCLTAQHARDNEQIVCHDATVTEPSHGLIYGHKTGSISNRLRDAAQWVIPPQPPAWADL